MFMMTFFLRCPRFKGFSWIPFVVVFSLSLISTSDGCRSDQFACRDGTACIRQSYRCDGEQECDDGSDETDCERPVANDFLLVSVVRQNPEDTHVRPQIYQIDLTTGQSKPLLKTDPVTPASLAVDRKRQVLYYVDRNIEMIGSVSLAQGNSSIRVIYRDPTLNVDLDGLAVDEEREKLYFSDGGSNPKIVEIDLLSQDRTQRIIISGSNIKPKAIVVDEVNRELYWTDWGSKPGIYVIKLEGNNARPHTLVSDNIVTPNALAIDFKEEVMYWVDAHLDRIEVSNLYGQDRRVLVRESADVHYYAMTVSPQFLYITDWTRRNVLRVDRATNITTSQIPPLSGLKTAVVYYSSNFTNVGRAGRTRPTFAPDETTTLLLTSSGRTSEVERIVKTATVAAPDKSKLSTAHGKVEAEKLVKEPGTDGHEVVIIGVVAAGSILIIIVIISLAIWCVRRRRRRTAVINTAFGYTPAVACDGGRSSGRRLLIEDAYLINDNCYERLPEVGMPPAPPDMRPEASGPSGMDDDEWYSKLDDNPDYQSGQSNGYYVIKKPKEGDYYDDTA